MGATLTQHPELARAGVAVGIYDMLRVELAQRGLQRDRVRHRQGPRSVQGAASPIRPITTSAGHAYPAVLLTTGANDGRVDPMQSRKFTAALEAATLRLPSCAHQRGRPRHGQLAHERIDEDADILASSTISSEWRGGMRRRPERRE